MRIVVAKLLILLFFTSLCVLLWGPFRSLTLSPILQAVLVLGSLVFGFLVVSLAPRRFDNRPVWWFILSYLFFFPFAVAAALVAAQAFGAKGPDNFGLGFQNELGACLLYLFLATVLTLDGRLLFIITSLDNPDPEN